MVRLKSFLLTATIAVFGLFSHSGLADGPYIELTHASTAGLSDRNLGRNFLHAGWELENGVTFSAGSYFVGRQRCLETLAFGKRFADGRWEASLIGHDEDTCALDSGEVFFERNVGLCLAREFQVLGRLVMGAGACAWERGDYAVGNLADPDDQLSVLDEPQLTFWLLGRFSFSADR